MSTMSTMSTVSRDDRVRPQTLAMASDKPFHPHLTVDVNQSMRVSPHYNQADSSGGPSTPTSTTYSAGPFSPYGSSIGSPVARFPNLWRDRTPNRRLSVPNGISPFHNASGGIYGPPLNSGPTTVIFQTPSNASVIPPSPANSNFSFAPTEHSMTDLELRRRTWHPSTYSGYNYQRPATSGLSYSQTPDAPRPAFAPQAIVAAGQPQRLPGFETFDQISQRPITPTRQPANDAPSRPPMLSGGSSDRSLPGTRERAWDMSLHQNLTKLDIANSTPPKDGGPWGRQVIAEMQSVAASASANLYAHETQNVLQQPSPQESLNRARGIYPDSSQPRNAASYQSRRAGWYGGMGTVPVPIFPAQRTSPAESSSSEGVHTPFNPAVDLHPLIVHPNGYIEANKSAPLPNSGFVVRN